MQLHEGHIPQIRRHESGQPQPALDAIRKLAVALSVKEGACRFSAADSGGS